MSPTKPDLWRARFYGILDTGYVIPEDWSVRCQQLITGGSNLIQLRAKAETMAQREALLTEMAAVFEETPVAELPVLIVNDFLELALRVPGAGLHVGQDDLDPREARRRLGSERVLGLSTHSLDQAKGAIALADTLDYFAVGPVFPTQTKPDYQSVGLELVEAVAALNPPLPWFCIGGINRGNVDQVVAAGGERVVVVSDVLCADDPAGAIGQLRSILPS